MWFRLCEGSFAEVFCEVEGAVAEHRLGCDKATLLELFRICILAIFWLYCSYHPTPIVYGELMA
jgi:hypothetical protein